MKVIFHPRINSWIIWLVKFLRFSVWLGNYLIILVLHGMFFGNTWLFKIHITILWNNWAVFQSKFVLNLRQYYVFCKKRKMCYMTLNESLMSYSLRSCMWIFYVSSFSRLVSTMTMIPQSFSVHFFDSNLKLLWNISH